MLKAVLVKSNHSFVLAAAVLLKGTRPAGSVGGVGRSQAAIVANAATAINRRCMGTPGWGRGTPPQRRRGAGDFGGALSIVARRYRAVNTGVTVAVTFAPPVAPPLPRDA